MKLKSMSIVGLAWVLAFLGCRRDERQTAHSLVDALVASVESDDGLALWQVLPPSIQEECGALFQRLHAQSDPRLWRAIDRLLADSAATLERQRSSLADAAPLREQIPRLEDRARVADGLIKALRLAAAHPLSASRAEGAELAAGAGPAILTALMAVLRAADSPLVTPWKGGPYELVMLGSDRAQYVRGAATDDRITEVLVRIEGGWIPERWLAAFRELSRSASVTYGSAAVSPLTRHGPQLLRLVDTARARLPRLRDAADQAQFDEALALVGGALETMLAWASTPPRPLKAQLTRSGGS